MEEVCAVTFQCSPCRAITKTCHFQNKHYVDLSLGKCCSKLHFMSRRCCVFLFSTQIQSSIYPPEGPVFFAKKGGNPIPKACIEKKKPKVRGLAKLKNKLGRRPCQETYVWPHLMDITTSMHLYPK